MNTNKDKASAVPSETVRRANQYRFMRGNWTKAEVKNETSDFASSVSLSGSTLVTDKKVINWKELIHGIPQSTATPNVTIINDFYMPQLKRSRRLSIFLPLDYQVSEKRYPVIYMHDGQNLFDVLTSFSGEWQVDETLNILQAHGDYGAIVVGVDNGGINRLNEYSPWRNPNYGGGQGDAYMDFIVHTLKPYIDSNYRTLPGRETTAMIGSSMGGLISLYGGIRHPDVFSKLGIFSPSLWFGNNIYKFVRSTLKGFHTKVYLMGGQHESKTMVSTMVRMYETLKTVGFSEEELALVVRPDGQHSEWFWAREFPMAYKWLFEDTLVSDHDDMLRTETSLFRNAKSNLLHIEQDAELHEVLLYNEQGAVVYNLQADEYENVPLFEVAPGTYFAQLNLNHRPVYRRLVVKS